MGPIRRFEEVAVRAGALCTGVCVLGAAISDCAVGKAREAAACAAGGGGRGLRWARGAAASWCQRAATAARVVAKRATGVGKRCSTKRFVCGMLVGSILLAGVVGPVGEWDAVEGASLPTVVSFGKEGKEQWIGVEVKAKEQWFGVEALQGAWGGSDGSYWKDGPSIEGFVRVGVGAGDAAVLVRFFDGLRDAPSAAEGIARGEALQQCTDRAMDAINVACIVGAEGRRGKKATGGRLGRRRRSQRGGEPPGRL